MTFVQGWGQFLFRNSISIPIPIPWLSIPILIPFYYPSALRAGGVLLYRYGWVAGWAARLPDFAECIFLKLLNGFPLFKAQWNCLDLKLCNVMIICQFAAYGLAHGPKTCQNWQQWGPDFVEHISLNLKLLDRFTPFKVLWNCLDLYLCHGHLPICPIWTCPWAKNLAYQVPLGSPHCGTQISETTGWITPFRILW